MRLSNSLPVVLICSGLNKEAQKALVQLHDGFLKNRLVLRPKGQIPSPRWRIQFLEDGCIGAVCGREI